MLSKRILFLTSTWMLFFSIASTVFLAVCYAVGISDSLMRANSNYTFYPWHEVDSDNLGWGAKMWIRYGEEDLLFVKYIFSQIRYPTTNEGFTSYKPGIISTQILWLPLALFCCACVAIMNLTKVPFSESHNPDTA